MTLIACPECRHDVSSSAVACPNCGYPITLDGDELVRAVESRQAAAAKKPLEPWDWKRIASFASRTRRAELLAAWAIGCTALFVGMALDYGVWGGLLLFSVVGFGIWCWLFIGSFVNRFHDLGNSGWLVLLSLIPFFGLFVLLAAALADGQKQPNRWGPPVA